MRILDKLKNWTALPELGLDLDIIEEVLREEESRIHPFFRSTGFRIFVLLLYVLLGTLHWRFFGR